jgi:hypothetical protein
VRSGVHSSLIANRQYPRAARRLAALVEHGYAVTGSAAAAVCPCERFQPGDALPTTHATDTARVLLARSAKWAAQHEECHAKNSSVMLPSSLIMTRW